MDENGIARDFNFWDYDMIRLCEKKRVTSTMAEQDRIRIVQQRLCTLLQQGYKFIVADEEGDNWFGSVNGGLPIECVLGTGFLGEISIQAPRS